MATCTGCGITPVPPICTPTVTDTPVFFRPVGSHTPVAGFIRVTVASDCTHMVEDLDWALVAFSELQPIVEVQYFASVGASSGTGGPVNWSDIVDRVSAPIATQNTSVANALAGKQATLTSGVNLRTINGQSLLGAGNLTISGGASSYPEVLNFAALPASPADGTTYVVLQAQGVPFINRKPAGLYRYSSSTWVYLGEVPDGYFTDNVLKFYDDADPTKQVTFQLSGITSGTTRTLTVPDASGTIALTSSLATVATSGAYGDLTGRPTLGTAAATDASAYATAAQGTDAREWSAPTVTQADAEAGTGTARVAWTVQRVWQAIAKALGGVTVNNTPTSGQVLKATSTTTAAWGTDDTGGGGGGSTDLSWSPSPTGGTVASSSGADAALTLADGTNAGLMAPAQHTKLAGIANNATANATDAQLRDRATHTGTQPINSITDLQATLNNLAQTGSVNAVTADVVVDFGVAANSLFNTGSTSRQFTVNTHTFPWFRGFAVDGPCTFVAGPGVVIADRRQTGLGFAHCQLVRRADNDYIIVGSSS